MNPPPLLPIHTHKHTKPSYFAIISSKNKMIMISSAQMSQPNGCESLGKDNIQLTLGIWYKPMCNYPLPPARHQPHPLSPSTQAINQQGRKQIVSYSLDSQTKIQHLERDRLGIQCLERNWSNQSPCESLIIVSKLASETVLWQNLIQIILGKPLNSLLFIILKPTPQKTTNSINAHDWCYMWGHPTQR